MINEDPRVGDCASRIETFLDKQNIKPFSKKRFPVDNNTFGYIYQLEHFGIEASVHSIIIFSKYNSRMIDLVDYENNDLLFEYVFPIIQEYIDDEDIGKNPLVKHFHKLKNALGLDRKSSD